jgi:hypothetical protein
MPLGHPRTQHARPPGHPRVLSLRAVPLLLLPPIAADANTRQCAKWRPQWTLVQLLRLGLELPRTATLSSCAACHRLDAGHSYSWLFCGFRADSHRMRFYRVERE